jgi:hypothetical protein
VCVCTFSPRKKKESEIRYKKWETTAVLKFLTEDNLRKFKKKL